METIEGYAFAPGAVLRVSGDDHAAFLQGQGTQDLRGPRGLCRHDLWLDHKGAIRGDAFVLKVADDHVLLASYATPAAVLVEKFERHIIADDVRIEDLTVDHEWLCVTPASAAALLRAAGVAAPARGCFSQKDGWLLFDGRRFGPGTLDVLYARSGRRPPLDTALTGAEAEARRVAAGVPMVPVDTDAASGALNPLEAGLPGSVCFDKGCYLGQEVVARLHRLQRASRRMVRATTAARLSPQPRPLAQGEALAGALTTVVETPHGSVALGWLKSRFPDGPLLIEGVEYLIESLPPS